MRTSAVAIIGLVVLALDACGVQHPYQQPSSVEELVTAQLPKGFAKQAELAGAVSAAAAQASTARGVMGSVTIEGSDYTPFLPSPSPSPSADAYLEALSDAQHHAATVAKAAGISLGRITAVREERGVTAPGYVSWPDRVVLRVDYGDSLTVYGMSSPSPPRYPFPPNQGAFSVHIRGTGPSVGDARSSAEALAKAVRDAMTSFGIPTQSIQTQGGTVSSS